MAKLTRHRFNNTPAGRYTHTPIVEGTLQTGCSHPSDRPLDLNVTLSLRQYADDAESIAVVHSLSLHGIEEVERVRNFLDDIAKRARFLAESKKGA